MRSASRIPALLLLVGALSTHAVRAASQRPAPVAMQTQGTAPRPSRPAPQQARPDDFDYLLGDWRFTAESKRWGHFTGYWGAVRLATGNGTHVLDEYRIVDDSGGTVLATSTLRALNRPAARWELVTVGAGTGIADRGTAHRVGDEMHVEQVFGAAEGKPEQWRIRYYNIRPDGFSWSGDRSTDGGRTWDTAYLRIEATRVGPPRDLPALAKAPVRVPVRVPARAPMPAPRKGA